MQYHCPDPNCSNKHTIYYGAGIKCEVCGKTVVQVKNDEKDISDSRYR